MEFLIKYLTPHIYKHKLAHPLCRKTVFKRKKAQLNGVGLGFPPKCRRLNGQTGNYTP